MMDSWREVERVGLPHIEAHKQIGGRLYRVFLWPFPDAMVWRQGAWRFLDGVERFDSLEAGCAAVDRMLARQAV